MSEEKQIVVDDVAQVTISVPGKHTEFSKADYLVLERPAIDSEYTAAVRKYIKGTEAEEEGKGESKQEDLLQHFSLSEALTAIKSYKVSSKNAPLKESLARISPDFEQLFMNGKDVISLDGGKPKKGKGGKKATVLKSKDITLLQIHKRDTLGPQLAKVKDFAEGVVKSKTSNRVIRSENHRIVLATSSGSEVASLSLSGEEQLFYLVTLLLLHSDAGKKPEAKSKHGWVHKHVTPALLHEARIALRRSAAPVAAALLARFDGWGGHEEAEAEDLLRSYSVGLFAPILRREVAAQGLVQMAPYQKDFADKVAGLVGGYADCIAGRQPWPERPQVLFNLNTFGSGKTTIGSIATAAALAQANAGGLPEGRRLVGVFVLPSLQTAVSFASVVAMTQATWIVQRGKVMPLFKFCPQYDLRRGRRLFRKVERWADRQGSAQERFRDGLDLRAPLREQVRMLLEWTPEWAETGRDYVFGHRRYQPPVIVFADSHSALELNRDRAHFEEAFGWHFLNIIDEFPATADCAFDLRENELLRNIVKIIMTENKFNVLMSASPRADQILGSPLFAPCAPAFAAESVTTRSFTQLFTAGELRPAHPLQGLDARTLPCVRAWNDTDLRFFPPAVVLALLATLRDQGHPFPLGLADVADQDALIHALRRLLRHAADLPEEVRAALCATPAPARAPVGGWANESSLTLTTGALQAEILAALDPKTRATRESVEALFAGVRRGLAQEVADARAELAQSAMAREKSQFGSKEAMLAKIEALERQAADALTHEVTVATNLGTARVTGAWWERYGDALSADQLGAVLSGLDVEFPDALMTAAIKEAVKKPRKVIDTITSMYGRNDHRTKNVFVKDPAGMIGVDTLKQALARAGRDGLTPVVSGVVDEHLLRLFRPDSETSVPRMGAVKEYIEAHPEEEGALEAAAAAAAALAPSLAALGLGAGGEEDEEDEEPAEEGTTNGGNEDAGGLEVIAPPPPPPPAAEEKAEAGIELAQPLVSEKDRLKAKFGSKKKKKATS